MRRHQAGHERADEGGKHPRRREGAEQPGTQRRLVGLTRDHVEQDDHDPGAEALNRPARDEDRHVPGEPGQQQSGRERGDAPGQRDAGPAPVTGVPADHHAHDRGDEEGAERPAVPGQPVELGHRGRHRRPDGHRLEGDEGDQHQQADGRAPVRPVEHRRRPARRHALANPCCLAGTFPDTRRAPIPGRGSALDAALGPAARCSALAGGDLLGGGGDDRVQVADDPKSASSKIGASGSLLMATIVFEVCMPARCWMAPEMPTAM